MVKRLNSVGVAVIGASLAAAGCGAATGDNDVGRQTQAVQVDQWSTIRFNYGNALAVVAPSGGGRTQQKRVSMTGTWHINGESTSAMTLQYNGNCLRDDIGALDTGACAMSGATWKVWPGYAGSLDSTFVLYNTSSQKCLKSPQANPSTSGLNLSTGTCLAGNNEVLFLDSQ